MRDLTVTFVVGATGSQTSCGAYDQRTLALEDGSGTLLVPATGFTASDLLDNDDPAMPADHVCHYTAVLEDVADADVYQLVYSSEGVHRQLTSVGFGHQMSVPASGDVSTAEAARHPLTP